MDYEDLEKKLQGQYFLVKRSRIWYLIGGAIAALFASGIISYSAILEAIKSDSGQAALRDIESKKREAEELVVKLQGLERKGQETLASLSDSYKKKVRAMDGQINKLLPLVTEMKTRTDSNEKIVEKMQNSALLKKGDTIILESGPDPSLCYRTNGKDAGISVVLGKCNDGFANVKIR